MPRQWKGPPGAPRAVYNLGAKEVLAAVESLYADQVQPLGRVLLKRVGERVALGKAMASGQASVTSAVNPDFIPCIDPKHLRKVCEKSEQITVEAIENGEYYALLRGRAPCFIDACSDQDPYPAQLWHDFAMYCASLETDEIFFPSGRYACAQALAHRNLACLAYRTLGELCHIVQLAITQKKILGYRDGHLVPYRHCEMMAKEQCAITQQPIASAKGTQPSAPIATWAQVHSCLRNILATQSSGAVPLPNVKRLFRSKFGLELSETSLGHSRLFELLRDPRLQDVCTVHLQDNKWTVTRSQVARPITNLRAPPGTFGPRPALAEVSPTATAAPLATTPPGSFTPPPPLWQPGSFTPAPFTPVDGTGSSYDSPCLTPVAGESAWQQHMQFALMEGNYCLPSAGYAKQYNEGTGSFGRPHSPPNSPGGYSYFSEKSTTTTTTIDMVDDDSCSSGMSTPTASEQGHSFEALIEADLRKQGHSFEALIEADLDRTSTAFLLGGFSLGGPEFVARSLRTRSDDIERPATEAEDVGPIEAVVKNTFIHLAPSPKNGRRSQSVPGRRLIC